MKPKLADLWTWPGEIGRGPYLFWGILLGFFKYNLDRILFWHWTGRRWSLLDYTRLGEYLWPTIPPVEDLMRLGIMLGVSIPFLAVGMLLTLKRLRALRLSPWIALLFFVPILKFLLFLALAVMPSRPVVREFREDREGGPRVWLGTFIPRSAKGSALAGILFALVSCALGVWFGTAVLRGYGWSLFIGLPFALGFLPVLIFGYHEERSRMRCMQVALCGLATGAIALLCVALEGVICLVMAAPLAMPITLLGASFAYHIQASDWWQGGSSRLFCIAAVVPAMMLLEAHQPAPLPLLRVQTSVIVNAPPERVWQHVVSFSELPPPREWLFQMGIAYPARARMEGAGVGAIRYCEFSTGSFIEPIEVWDEPRLLRFSVTHNPAPMQEWTPYRDVHPPHLDNFLESRAGQFLLEPLGGNRTRLEGTTWYYHHMWPASYWQWWSDFIIHRIHSRVLRHVKQLSEQETGPGVPL